MTKEKTKSVLKVYEDLLKEISGYGCGERTKKPGDFSHLIWMCQAASDLVDQDRIEKAMRWLGFIQGSIWSMGYRTLDQIKTDVMPSDVKFEENAF